MTHDFLATPVPGDWLGPHPGGPTLPALGTASYRLRVEGLRPGRYILYLSHGFHAATVAVNGKADPGESVLPPEQHITQITPRPRQAFLLVALEGFSEEDAAQVLAKIMLEDAPPLVRDDLPAAMIALVARMLAKQPADRPSGAGGCRGRPCGA